MTRPDETMLTITVPAWWVAEQSEDAENEGLHSRLAVLAATTPERRDLAREWAARWGVVEDALNAALTESGR